MTEWTRDQTGWKAAPSQIERPGPADPVGPFPQAMREQRAQLARTWALNLTPAQVWNSQPYLRIVVPFIARNVAQLGVHVFRRVGETDRQRVRTGPVADLFRRPNASTTQFRMVYGLVVDKCLYDRAYWAVGSGPDGRPQAVRIPPARVLRHNAPDPLGPVESITVWRPDGSPFDIPGSNLVLFNGYHPLDPYGMPSSPIDALRSIIAEQASAFEFRQATWDNGGQINQAIYRPADAPPWSGKARDRFLDDVRHEYGKGGGQRGGIALFEDGMTLNATAFNSHEAEWVEASKLSLSLVASIYHVNPTMVGVLDNANYSNVREFRRALYGDSLGPLLAELEDEWNTFLLPMLGADDSTYLEFNIQEKLQGSFEEQATAFQTAVGGPWMTRAEARARLNLPALPEDSDADELIVPLNVLIGGQASPTDSAPAPSGPTQGPEQDDSRPTDETGDQPAQSSGRVAVKARRTARTPELDPHTAKATEAMRAFFRRQAGAVLSRLGAKAAWWDQGRWDRELAKELESLGVSTTTEVAAKTLESLDISPDTYDVARTEAFIKALATRIAGQINATTKAHLDEAISDPDSDPAHVFEVAESSRAEQVATTVITTFGAFGATESAKQGAGDRAFKVWVTGSNPRAEHARMDGETVPIDEKFSNGALWPGDHVLDVDQVAGCNCRIDLIVED